MLDEALPAKKGEGKSLLDDKTSRSEKIKNFRTLKLKYEEKLDKAIKENQKKSR